MTSKMITVKDLQELLSTYHPDDVVILAKDEGGNSLSPLEKVSDHIYKAETTWSGEILESWEDGAVPCVVFWPTH